MGQTITEKIFGEHVGREVVPGEIIVSPVDLVFFHDGNRPQPSVNFAELGASRVFDSSKIVMFIDHSPTTHTKAVAEVHELMREFAREQGIALYNAGMGISHRVIPEEGYAIPGSLIVGADSHTCTAGAFNLLATGLGSADLAAAMMLGTLWFRVPQTMKLVSNGRLRRGVYAKDLAMYWLKKLGADGANYCALEFVGSAISQLSMEERMTITNAAVEMGAKFGIMEADEATLKYSSDNPGKVKNTYSSDPDAQFLEVFHFDASSLEPQVALPPSPDNVVNVSEVVRIPIRHATIGTCSSAQIEDLRIAVEVLGDKTISKDVKLFVAPATHQTYLKALHEGIVERLVEAGALWGTPGCSGCTGGSAFGVPADGENQISSAPRNFTGRTGNPAANIYLASPATVMASAITGQITDPRTFLKTDLAYSVTESDQGVAHS